MINIKEIYRFGLVGIFSTGIHYGIYLLLKNFISLNIAYSIGYICSFCINFVLSANFTFQTKPSIKKGVGFSLSHLINYGLHLILLNFFLYLNLSTTYAPIPVFMIAIPVNFVLVRFVFKSSKI
jgi:putative flippase GtrA